MPMPIAIDTLFRHDCHITPPAISWCCHHYCLLILRDYFHYAFHDITGCHYAAARCWYCHCRHWLIHIGDSLQLAAAAFHYYHRYSYHDTILRPFSLVIIINTFVIAITLADYFSLWCWWCHWHWLLLLPLMLPIDAADTSFLDAAITPYCRCCRYVALMSMPAD